MARMMRHAPTGPTFDLSPAAGDEGKTSDGIPWKIGSDGTKFYFGDCGGCGGCYPTPYLSYAERGACTRCDPGSFDNCNQDDEQGPNAFGVRPRDSY